jgi:hypothetical protein
MKFLREMEIVGESGPARKFSSDCPQDEKEKLSRWWTTKGIFAARLRDTEEEALRICVRKWGPLLVHIFDRGYASANWLTILGKYRARFVIRWIGKHLFWTLAGEKKKEGGNITF